MLVQNYRDEHGDGDDKEIRTEIFRAIDARPTLGNKKDLIEDFGDSLSANSTVDHEWQEFITGKREADLETIIVDENLRPDETRVFTRPHFAPARSAPATQRSHKCHHRYHGSPQMVATAKRINA